MMRKSYKNQHIKLVNTKGRKAGTPTDLAGELGRQTINKQVWMLSVGWDARGYHDYIEVMRINRNPVKRDHLVG